MSPSSYSSSHQPPLQDIYFSNLPLVLLLLPIERPGPDTELCTHKYQSVCVYVYVLCVYAYLKQFIWTSQDLSSLSQQERLLLSLLPAHIARVMKAEIIQRLQGPRDRDFGRAEGTNNFHNLYVQRHTNVR